MPNHSSQTEFCRDYEKVDSHRLPPIFQQAIDCLSSPGFHEYVRKQDTAQYLLPPTTITDDSQANPKAPPTETIDQRSWVVPGDAYGSTEALELNTVRTNGAVLDLNSERARLERDIQSNPNRQEVSQSMSLLEQRAASSGLSSNEVAGVYEQVSRLLEDPKSRDSKGNSSQKLAEQVLAQSATPAIIGQGTQNTCTLASLEKVIYSREPSVAAKLVTDVALDGSFTTTNGMVVAPDKNSLLPDANSQQKLNLQGSHRSLASQYFQIATSQLNCDITSEISGQPGRFKYVELTNERRQSNERIIDTQNNNAFLIDGSGRPIDGPNVAADRVVEMYKSLTGKDDNDLLMTRNYIDGGLVPKDGKDFVDKLESLKEQGKLPVMLAVDAFNEPFSRDINADTWNHPGAATGHFVVINDVTGGSQPTISVENSWGERTDHVYSANEIYLSMMKAGSPEAIRAREEQVDSDRAAGKVSSADQILLLQQRNLAGSSPELAREFVDLAKQTQMRWQQERLDGTFDQAEHDHGIALFRKLAPYVGPQGLEMLAFEYKQGAYGEGDHATQLFQHAIAQRYLHACFAWSQEGKYQTIDAQEQNKAFTGLTEALSTLTPQESQATLDDIQNQLQRFSSQIFGANEPAVMSDDNQLDQHATLNDLAQELP